VAQSDAYASVGIELVVHLSEREPLERPGDSIERVWIPSVDDGSRRAEGWFEDVCSAAEGKSVLLQCHLGVSRAPSAAYALLLCRELDECSALEVVMRQRLVATAVYASEAYEWFAGGDATPERVEYLEVLRQRLIRENRARLAA
jgi:hypothetical protein